MRFFIIGTIIIMFIVAVPAGAQQYVFAQEGNIQPQDTVAAKNTAQPNAPVVPVQPETTLNTKPTTSTETVEWNWGYVSGVSKDIITVVVPTTTRRQSYEPIQITPETKITQGGRSATLQNIRIWQRVSIRGVRSGDIVRATEFLIGGRFPRITATKKKTVTPAAKLKSAVVKKALPKSKNVAPKAAKKAVTPPKKSIPKTKAALKKK